MASARSSPGSCPDSEVSRKISNQKDLRELIALRALDDAVEDEDVAVRLGLEDEHVLVEGLLDVEDFVDLEGHGLARPLGRDLAEPAICEHR